MCFLCVADSSYVSHGTCYIDYIGVTDHARGKGVGKILMERAEYEARLRKCKVTKTAVSNFRALVPQADANVHTFNKIIHFVQSWVCFKNKIGKKSFVHGHKLRFLIQLRLIVVKLQCLLV